MRINSIKIYKIRLFYQILSFSFQFVSCSELLASRSTKYINFVKYFELWTINDVQKSACKQSIIDENLLKTKSMILKNDDNIIINIIDVKYFDIVD